MPVASAQAGQCIARSGDRTSALVELYTADGCSACLPADRWLSGLGQREGLLPFALHVDYGDYTGTKPAVYRRHRKLTVLQRMALVYAPQVKLQGRDMRGWETRAFDAAVARINARPARASIGLDIVSLGGAAMTVRASVELTEAGRAASLYLAAFETQPQRRRRVILEWQGPLPLTVERRLPLLPKAVPSRSGVAAFVEDRRGGEVLQALALPACPDTFGYIRPK